MDEQKQKIQKWIDRICPELSTEEKEQAIQNVVDLIDWLVLTEHEIQSNVEDK